MLEHAVHRAAMLTPRNRVVVVATAHHRCYVEECLGPASPELVLLQPDQRDTAPGIIFPRRTSPSESTRGRGCAPVGPLLTTGPAVHAGSRRGNVVVHVELQPTGDSARRRSNGSRTRIRVAQPRCATGSLWR